MRWLILLLCIPLVSGLEWSEIMFDAVGSDNGKEYIELVGTENLENCTITDSKSSDILTKVQDGTNVILIIEEDGSFETDATIYHAGKAIGNGLGNSYEELTITCEEDLLSTSYNLSVEPGQSIHYENGWITGNATPGTIQVQETTRIPPSGSFFCNTTLQILSNTSGYVGDALSFKIVSAGYASFTVEENESIFLEGDTLTRNEYSFTLESDVMITAFAQECDAKQRAKRKILSIPRPIKVKNVTVNTTIKTEKPKIREPLPLVLPEPEKIEPLYEKDANMIPWISAFGMVTLIVSAGLFWYERKND